MIDREDRNTCTCHVSLRVIYLSIRVNYSRLLWWFVIDRLILRPKKIYCSMMKSEYSYEILFFYQFGTHYSFYHLSINWIVNRIFDFKRDTSNWINIQWKEKRIVSNEIINIVIPFPLKKLSRSCRRRAGRMRDTINVWNGYIRFSIGRMTNLKDEENSRDTPWWARLFL